MKFAAPSFLRLALAVLILLAGVPPACADTDTCGMPCCRQKAGSAPDAPAGCCTPPSDRPSDIGSGCSGRPDDTARELVPCGSLWTPVLAAVPIGPAAQDRNYSGWTANPIPDSPLKTPLYLSFQSLVI